MSEIFGIADPALERDQLMGARLAAAHGHLVLDASGAPLGRLAWLRYGLDDRRPETLMVRPGGWRGLWSRHERPVPFDAVRLTLTGRREVLTDLPPARTGERAEGSALARRGATH